MNIIGLDACKYGWCGVGLIEDELIWACFSGLDELLQKQPNLNRLLIDIPIGLSSKNFRRTVDALARTYLNKRKSSIFSPPCRGALYAENYKEALAKNREIEGKGISIQAYNIGEKIKEVDEYINHKPKQIEIYEAHPELCFKSLNQNTDLAFSKHDKAGIEERKQIISKHKKDLLKIYNLFMKEYKRNQLKPDDILDAMALFLVNFKSEKLEIICDENQIDETSKKVCIVRGFK